MTEPISVELIAISISRITIATMMTVPRRCFRSDDLKPVRLFRDRILFMVAPPDLEACLTPEWDQEFHLQQLWA